MTAFRTLCFAVASLYLLPGGNTADILLCGTQDPFQTIQCPENSVIQVHLAIATYMGELCSQSAVTGAPEDCKTELTDVFLSCHGEQNCDFETNVVMNTPGESCSVSMRYVLLVHYTCFQIDPATMAVLPLSSSETRQSEVLHIFSPDFPESIPSSISSIQTCRIQPVDTEIKNVVLKIERIFIRMSSTSTYCQERLHFNARNDLTFCSDRDGNDGYNENSTLVVFGDLEMQYSKPKGQTGGKFWIRITATGEAVTLKISCPNVAWAGGGPIPIDSSVTKALETTTVAAETENTTDVERDMEHTDEGNGDNNNGAILYGVIGTLVAVVVVLIVIFLIMRFRKHKKGQPPHDSDYTSPNTEGLESQETGYENLTPDYLIPMPSTIKTEDSEYEYTSVYEGNNERTTTNDSPPELDEDEANADLKYKGRVAVKQYKVTSDDNDTIDAEPEEDEDVVTGHVAIKEYDN